MRSHTTEPLDSSPPTTKRRRRWPLLLAAFGLFTALAVWLAPTIVAKSPLRQQLVPWAVPDLDCRVQIGSASLGWFSPIALNDVAVSDSAGESLAVVGEVRSEKTIWALISDASQLGRFDIRQPQVNIVLREDGSNLQDALASLLTPTDAPPAALSVQLRVTEGRVDVTDQVSGRKLQVADLGIELNKPLATDQPLTSTLQATLGSGDEAGTVRADVTWVPAQDAAADSLGRGEVKLALDSITFAAVEPLLNRFAPGMRLAGRVSSELALGFRGSAAQPAAEVSGWVRTGDFVLDAPAWLGSDRLWSETVELNGRVALIDGRLELVGTGIQTDLAHVKLNGSAPVAQLAEKPWVPWLVETLQSEDYQLEGEIDLARLAAMLPGTLRVREGTEITSGRVAFQSQGLVVEGQRTWLGSIHTAQLAATANGNPVSWEAPLEFSLAAHQSDQGPVVDKLVCNADFLEVEASGDWREARLKIQGDLDQLATELNQFFDLGSLELAGKFGATLTFLHPQEDRLEVVLATGVHGLMLSLPGGKTLSEPDLQVEATALALGDGTGLRSAERIEFTLIAGADVAKIRLLHPVEAPSWNSSWPLAVDVSGDLQGWLHRLQPWVSTQGWDISGSSHVVGEVSFSPDKIVVQDAVVDLARLHAHGSGLYVDEPHVRIETTCSWDQSTGQLTAPKLTLTASDPGGPEGETVAVEVRAEQVAVQLAEPGPPKLSGNVALRGSLQRFTQWTTDPRYQPTQYVGGLVSGKANLECAGGAQTHGTWSMTVDNLVYATLQTTPRPRTARQPGAVAPAAATARWEPVWREARVTIEGQAQYDFSADALRLDRLDVASEMLHLTAAGNIDELSGRRLTKLTGEVDYDLNQVTTKLGHLLGPQVVLRGRQQRSFSVQGPLVFTQSVAASGDHPPTRLASRVSPAEGFAWPQELTGSAGFGWTAADLFGLQAGEGNFDAQLADGVVTAPVDVSINGGRIRLAPRMVLGQSPAMLLIDQGRAVENVQITDQMSSSWLKFVAPLFADATRIDGRFSMDVGHAQVPLAAPKTGNVAGTLHIHSARLRPGPMFDQFLILAQQIQALIELRPLSQASAVPRSGLVEVDPQSVPFQMVDGRVYHRDLTLNVRGVRIRTSGSVGLDQSVAMVAEVPILEEWGQGGGVLASLGGKSLKIPIRGHLGQPKLDDKVLRQVARNVAEGAAGRLIEKGLDRALDGIFRPGGLGSP